MINGSLVLVAGNLPRNKKVEMVSFTQNKALPDIDIALWGHCVTKISENKIMVTGGWNGSRYSDKTLIFDFSTEIWTSSHLLINGRSGHGCAMFKLQGNSEKNELCSI